MGTAVVGLLLIIVVSQVIRSMIRDKKNGKSLQCGCDCKHCSGHFLLEVAKVGWWLLMIERTNVRRDERYQRTQMQKEAILDALRAKGLRITKQRKIILDIILGEDCSCCKEIYYQVREKDHTVGIATVYRMIKTLEEAGVIDRRNMYRIGSMKEGA